MAPARSLPLAALLSALARDASGVHIALEREREEARLAAFVSAVPKVTKVPHDPVALWAPASSDALGAHERRAAFERLTSANYRRARPSAAGPLTSPSGRSAWPGVSAATRRQRRQVTG